MNLYPSSFTIITVVQPVFCPENKGMEIMVHLASYFYAESMVVDDGCDDLIAHLSRAIRSTQSSLQYSHKTHSKIQ